MTVVRCRACDLVYVSPTFDEAHYLEVYASQEYQDIVKDLGHQEPRLPRRALRPRARSG